MDENTRNILIGAAIVVIILGFTIYSIVMNKKRKDARWTGVVSDKTMHESYRSNTNKNDNQSSSGFTISLRGRQDQIVDRSYEIHVKPETGEEFKWPVSESFYQIVQIGDHLTKNPGTVTPEISTKVS